MNTEREQLLHDLQDLLCKLGRVDEALKLCAAAEKKLAACANATGKKLAAFDAVNMPRFIRERIGDEPLPPEKSKHSGPVYQLKLKAYTKLHDEYLKNRAACEQMYYESFAATRNKLAAADRETLAQNKLMTEAALASAREQLEAARAVVAADTTFPVEVRNTSSVTRLINYLETGRADTLKEALRLLYDDNRFSSLEALIAEQKRFAQEARDYALKAMELAQSAQDSLSDVADSARMALDRTKAACEAAEAAGSRAEDAYALADRAYDLADEAYAAAIVL